MAVELICQHCAARLRLQDDIGGDRLTCPHCRAHVLSPADETIELEWRRIEKPLPEEEPADFLQGCAMVLVVLIPLVAIIALIFALAVPLMW